MTPQKNDQKADEFRDMVVEFFVLAGAFNISDYLPAIEWLDLQGVTDRMKKLHRKFDNLIGTILEEQKAKQGEVDDSDGCGSLMNTLITLQDNCDGERTKLSDDEIKAVLLAVIKETFRLHPRAPISVPRMAINSREINGYHIPKGSTLLLNIWAIGGDPEVWADPLEFRPERFLPNGERPNVDVKGNDFELIPFGSGRRICIGMNLGIRMVQLVTATLAHSFNMKLANGLEPQNLNMEEAYGLT